MRDVGPNLLQVYLFVSPQKKKMKRREYRKNTDAKWCGSSKGKTRQDKTRQDINYRNIASTIVWHAVSKKTLVEACQINSITNQILYYNK